MGNKGERAVEALEGICCQLETFVGTEGQRQLLDDLDLVYKKARKFLEKKEGG